MPFFGGVPMRSLGGRRFVPVCPLRRAALPLDAAGIPDDASIAG